MTHAMYMAVVCLMATLVAQANQCSGGGECPSDINPNNVASLLEVSLLQTKLQMNVLKGGGEESSSEALRGVKSTGKKDPRQLDMLMVKNASAMLSEFEGMISAGEAPAFDVISQIKGLVENDLMPGLATLQNLSAQDTNEFLDAIQACNNDSKANEGEIERGRQVSVNSSRFSHVACRD